MTQTDFEALFTRESLRPFQPQPGSDGLTPRLEVHTPTAIAVFVLAVDDFNDGATRLTYLHTLGRRCAEDYPDVEAIRFGSEAWLRTFTPEEAALRGNRLVETYPDKEEGIIVLGQLAEGGCLLAQAKLYRRPTGAVERVGAWQVRSQRGTSRLQIPLLDAYWEGYRHGKARQN